MIWFRVLLDWLKVAVQSVFVDAMKGKKKAGDFGEGDGKPLYP